jgi:hypothetical protein
VGWQIEVENAYERYGVVEEVRVQCLARQTRIEEDWRMNVDAVDDRSPRVDALSFSNAARSTRMRAIPPVDPMATSAVSWILNCSAGLNLSMH